MRSPVFFRGNLRGEAVSKGLVLIVDDHEENCYLLKTLLKADGFGVETAPNGAEALDKARKNRPLLVISDILMPVMDGFALCREWKKDPDLSTIPFVFYTATYTDEKDRQFGLELGAADFLVKPMEPQEIQRRVAEILSRAGSGTPPRPAAPAGGEEIYLKQYNQVLVHKLENKMADLEKTVWELEKEKAERQKTEEERENLRAQLYQAQKMESIGRLAGGVAHDFNNMLSIIISYTDLVRSQIKADDPLREDLQKILDAARRSSELTRQLLTFARKETVASKVVDLNEAVGGMVQFLRRLLGENIELVWKPRGNSARVKVGSSHIDQILTNLCINAKDAIPGTGRIEITTGNFDFDTDYCARHPGYLPGQFVRLMVSDTGSGMPPEVLAKIFEPFYTTKGPGKGTGLGLSTVYGIVQQDKGFLTVKSEPGKGTAFEIYLPIHQGPEAAPAPEAPPPPLMKGEANILLVEDEPAILQITTRILKNLGYNVLAFTSPREALLKGADKDKIHLLITDVIMPEMSGLELSRKLQARFPGLRCLYMSGYTADAMDDSNVLEEGAQFIQKPFTVKELSEKVREALG